MAVLDVSPLRYEAKAIDQTADWQSYEKILFRFIFLYVGIQLLPLDGQFFQNLFTIKGGYTHYFFTLSRYAPHFFGAQDTFLNWLVVAIIAVIGTTIWTARANPVANYDSLYYWLRVALRYRLAIGLIAYGFIKLFPLQAPLPSISNLNTDYGDHSAWKLFSLTLGIVPSYQSFLGGIELVGGLLLLHRKTATIGTLIILPFLGNVLFSNLAYEGGEYVYSGLLITFALVLFAFDAIRLFRLLSLELPTAPNRFQPIFSEQWQRYARLAFKSAFVLFAVVLYGYSTYAAYRKGPVRFSRTPGLPGAAGLYNVSEFRVGNKILPYSKTDPIRWQDVVFETWNTISIKSNRPVKLVNTNVEQIPGDDRTSESTDRDYELAGSQGRHYYHYTVDSTRRLLTLKNANPNHAAETMQLAYTRANGQIILSGIASSGGDEKRDSIYAVLNKINKKYLIDEAAKAGRRGAIKL